MKMEIRGRVFHGNILPLLWTFTPEFGTIVGVSLYTNEEILCTGRIKQLGKASGFYDSGSDLPAGGIFLAYTLRHRTVNLYTNYIYANLSIVLILIDVCLLIS